MNADYLPPLPRLNGVRKATEAILSEGDISSTLMYKDALIRYAKWRFIAATILMCVETGFFIAQVHFLLNILEFIQDEELGRSVDVTAAYLNAVGLSLTTLL